MQRKDNPALGTAGGSLWEGFPVPHFLQLPPSRSGGSLAPGKPLFPGDLFLLHDSWVSHSAQFLSVRSTLGPGSPNDKAMWGGPWEAHRLLGNTDLIKTEILGSCGCCKKAPQTMRLGTTGSHPLALPKAKSLKPKCEQGWLLLEAPRKDLSHASSGFHPPSPHPTPLDLTHPSPLHITVSSLLSLLRMLVRFRAHPNPG